MKRLYLFAFIIFWGGIARGQTLGFKINPEADMRQGAPKPYFGMSCGMYYNQKIYKPLGFSTGLEYTQVRFGTNELGFDAFGGPVNFPHQQRMHLIAIPMDMTLMMNENISAKCLVYFTIGYAFGEVFEK